MTEVVAITCIFGLPMLVLGYFITLRFNEKKQALAIIRYAAEHDKSIDERFIEYYAPKKKVHSTPPLRTSLALLFSGVILCVIGSYESEVNALFYIGLFPIGFAAANLIELIVKKRQSI